jgi:predicted  nucleic acid-binding Zn-ribbon protein
MSENRDVECAEEPVLTTAVTTPEPDESAPPETAPAEFAPAGESRGEAAGAPPPSVSPAPPALAQAAPVQAAPARPVSARRPTEWSRAKESFVSILDEAGDAVRVFEQEKRRILGLTHALTQIQQSFDSLHIRFAEMEKTVSTAVAEREGLDQRFEATAAELRGCQQSEAELAKDNAALRAAIAQVEGRLAQNGESIAAMAEENRKLRERLVAMERDGGLIVDEIARIRNELITLNEHNYETEAAPPAPLAAIDRRGGDVAPAVQTEEPAPRSRAGMTGDLAVMVNDLTQALAQHKGELGRLFERGESLVPPTSQSIRATPSRRPAEPPVSAREAPPVEMSSRRYIQPQSAEAARSDYGAAASAGEDEAGLSGAPQGLRDAVDINALCSVFEKRSMDLRIELLRERRERQAAENALQSARNERAQLQRELAKVQTKQWRAAPPQEDPYEPPLDPPEPANRDFVPAQYRRY